MTRFAMRKTWTALLLALCFPVLSRGAEYALEDCLRIAEEKSSDIRDYREQIAKVDAQISEAYGNAMPSIDFSAQFTRDWYDAAKTGSTPAFLDPNDPAFDASAAMAAGFLGSSMAPKPWQLQAGLTLTQILYAQGKVSTGVDIAKETKRMMEVQLDAKLRDLSSNVRKTFMQVLYVEEAVAVYDSAVAQAGRYRELAQSMYEQGMANELTALRARVSEEDLVAGQRKMQADLQLLRYSLLNVMGLEADSTARFVGTLDGDLPRVELEEAVSAAMANRQELKQLERGRKIQEKLVDIQTANYKPTVVLGAAYTKTGGWDEFSDIDFEMGTDKRIFLMASWNIFNGMQTKNKAAQARTEVRRMEISDETARRGIRLEIESLWNAYEEAVSRLPVRERQEELSKKALEIAEKTWAVGNSTQLVLLDAQLSWRNAKLDLLKARMDAQVAYRALEAAQGKR